MPTLSSSIVQRGLASMRDVEEALARQVIYGGDLATNLLELARVSEGQLTLLLAQSHDLPSAPIGKLPQSLQDTLNLVPSDLAMRHGFYPLAQDQKTLVVAVSRPLPDEIREHLEFSLGLSLEQQAAPLVRIHQALNRDYSHSLDRRTLRLIAKLEGKPDPSPSSMPARGGSAIIAIPRPASIPPLDSGSRQIDKTDGTRGFETEEAPKKADAPAGIAQLSTLISAREATPRSPSNPVPSVRVHRGPYALGEVERDLLGATTPDQALDAFFAFASQFFEYSAVFAIHSEIAEGRDARGRGADRQRIRGIGVPLDLPSSLAKVRGNLAPWIGQLSGEGLDEKLARDLERTENGKVILLPVVLRNRPVLILYGDQGQADVELAELGEIVALAPVVGSTLERIILARKGRGSTLPRAPISEPRRTLPDPSQRAEALSHALSQPAAPTRAPSTDQDSPNAKNNSTRDKQADSKAVQTAKQAPQALGRERTDVTISPITVVASPQGSARKADHVPTTKSESPRAKQPSQTPPEPEKRRPTPPHGTEVEPTEAAPFPLTRRASDSEETEVPISSETPSVDSDAMTRRWHREEEEARETPAGRRAFHGPHRPRKPYDPSAGDLPTVIVDQNPTCGPLLERLLSGDDQARNEIIELGEMAVGPLVGVFPGPIHADYENKFASPEARASEGGRIERD